MIATGRPDEAEQYLRRNAETSKEPQAALMLADYYLAARRYADAIATSRSPNQTAATPPVATGGRRRAARPAYGRHPSSPSRER